MKTSLWMVLILSLMVVAHGIEDSGTLKGANLRTLDEAERFMLHLHLLSSMVKSPFWKTLSKSQQEYAIWWIGALVRREVPQWYHLGG